MVLHAMIGAPIVHVIPHIGNALAKLDADVVIPLFLGLVRIRIDNLVNLSGNLLGLLHSLLDLLLVVTHVKGIPAANHIVTKFLLRAISKHASKVQRMISPQHRRVEITWEITDLSSLNELLHLLFSNVLPGSSLGESGAAHDARAPVLRSA